MVTLALQALFYLIIVRVLSLNGLGAYAAAGTFFTLQQKLLLYYDKPLINLLRV